MHERKFVIWGLQNRNCILIWNWLIFIRGNQNWLCAEGAAQRYLPCVCETLSSLSSSAKKGGRSEGLYAVHTLRSRKMYQNFMFTGLEIYSKWPALTTQGPNGDKRLLRTSPAGYMSASLLHPVTQPCTQGLTAWRLSVLCQMSGSSSGRCSASERQVWFSPGQKGNRIVLGWLVQPEHLWP